MKIIRKQNRSWRRQAFTLVEIMIVVGILGVVLGIAAPTWVRQREVSRQRVCQENLTKVDGAKEQYAMDNNVPEGGAVALENLYTGNPATSYLKVEPICPAGGTYVPGNLGVDPICDSLEEGHSLGEIVDAIR